MSYIFLVFSSFDFVDFLSRSFCVGLLYALTQPQVALRRQARV